MLVSLLIFTIIKAQPIIYHNKHCACQELNQEECSQLQNECKYEENACQPILQWQDCNLYDKQSQCIQNKCYWNKNNECNSFSKCDDYNPQFCPIDQDCINKNGRCSNYEYVDCNQQMDQSTCKGRSSQQKICIWNSEEWQCQEISNSPSCDELDNFVELCYFFQCEYHQEFLQCLPKNCDENKELKRITQFSSYYCGMEIENLSEKDCFNSTSFNYKFDSETYQCKQCQTLVEYMDGLNITLALFIYLLLI